ncbi:FkbM family methyltransferase [Synechocystis sp. FACHB-383]|uniref:FkbM family methyltransferase n=1 Tax=Synechocystis sp. FACHB-383 TaxID=2692864 RepID=UPI0016867348|nr:FkbM family methyltransferase [Synechocystis sp. FACHB-383]MBD2654401.1 FkbM family methyltransferase [Synechocystis sp. FACHB-383]
MSVFLEALKRHGHLTNLHMTVCNVGSRKLGQHDDYGSSDWGIFAPNLTIYGFDADADACDAANTDLENRQVNWNEEHIPIALSDKVGERTLYVTQNPMCSSLYPPNEPYLARFQGLPELVNLDFSIGLETTTLDEFCREARINQIDFLQVDVQGADLSVLEGGQEILKTIFAVQIEVEFSHLYEGQPLFADVDVYLRKRDFTLFDLATSYGVRSRSPIASRIRPGQLLWADAFYFRDLLQKTKNDPQKLLKLTFIADILNFPDYALEIMEYLTLNYGSDPRYNLADVILDGLSQFPDLVQQDLGSLEIIQRVFD